MAIRRSAFVIILAAVLLSSLVGVASAVSHSWYMTGYAAGTLEGADYWMQKGSGAGPADKVIDPGTFKIWGADEPVSVNQIDMAGQWDVHMKLTHETKQPMKVKVEIGKVSSGAFTGFGEKELTLDQPYDSRTRWWNSTEINPGSFPISEGESLAVRVTNNDTDGKTITVVTTDVLTSPSYIASPDSDPGYPVPELPTIVLTCMGVLLLVGFVAYSRRRNIK